MPGRSHVTARDTHWQLRLHHGFVAQRLRIEAQTDLVDCPPTNYFDGRKMRSTIAKYQWQISLKLFFVLIVAAALLVVVALQWRQASELKSLKAENEILKFHRTLSIVVCDLDLDNPEHLRAFHTIQRCEPAFATYIDKCSYGFDHRLGFDIIVVGNFSNNSKLPETCAIALVKRTELIDIQAVMCPFDPPFFRGTTLDARICNLGSNEPAKIVVDFFASSNRKKILGTSTYEISNEGFEMTSRSAASK